MNNTVKASGIKDYTLLYLSFVVYSFVAVLSKMAATQIFLSIKFILFLGAEIALLGVFALLWQQCLKRFDLMHAYASKSTVVLWNLCWAMVFFQEKITFGNIVGSMIIILGIVVVSTDEH